MTSADQAQGNRPAQRMGSLDLLRLVSALAVVAFHYLFRGSAGQVPYLDHPYPAAQAMALYGYLGLNLFFMISGFVIAWSAEGRTFRAFAIARFARLYPGFVICMTITFAVLLFAGDPRLPVGTAQYAANLAMIPQVFGQPFMDGVYWTIVLELVFYGWVSLAILSGLFASRKLLLLTSWLAISMVNEYWLGSGALRMVLITEYAPFFAGGVLAHHIVSRGWRVDAVLLAFAAFLMALTHMKGMQGWMMAHYGIAPGNQALAISGLVLHLVFWAAVAARGLLPSTGLVMMLGGLTYPLYLLHQNIGYVGINALTPLLGQTAALVATLCAILLVSWLVWRHGETPGRRMIATLLNRGADWLVSRPLVRRMVLARQ